MEMDYNRFNNEMIISKGVVQGRIKTTGENRLGVINLLEIL